MANLTEYEKKPLGERMKRRLAIQWRRLVVAALTPSRLITGGFIIALWVALGWPVYQKSTAQGVLHTVFSLFVVLAKARMLGGKSQMQIVSRQYLERKIGLYRLIKQMQRRNALTVDEVLDYQRQVLEIIASYVRGHRADLGGTKVYVNMVILLDGELVVAARNDPTRKLGARYKPSDMWLARIFETGEPDATGDVAKEFPASAGKPYKSILGLPLLVKDRVLAVISIDSRNKFEFDGEVEDLTRALAPYVALLEWTLNSDVVGIPSATPDRRSSAEALPGEDHGTNLPSP